MELEALQKKYDRLYHLTKKMRGWQRQWYTYHIESDKQIMMRVQREVDSIIKVEDEEIKKKQKELF